MLQQINRKILIYLFIFLSLGTYTNKEFSKLSYPKIKSYEITGLSKFQNYKINQDLFALQNQNLFFLKENEVSKIISSHRDVEKFFVFKNYPSNLHVKIEKTSFLAITKKNGLDFYIGSNGNLIKVNNKIDLPYLFGDIEITEFLKFKEIIDASNFDYNEIKSLYYFKSKRWDIETKNNQIIKLPIEKLKLSLEILIKIYNNNELKDFKVIDFRQNKLIILNG